MEQQEKAISSFTFQGKEYDLESLSPDGKYLVSQLRDLQMQKQGLNGKLHQVDMSIKGFSEALAVELPTEDSEE